MMDAAYPFESIFTKYSDKELLKQAARCHELERKDMMNLVEELAMRLWRANERD